tara:strand:+ start:608 stop:757 length:150 start_codon:yes stop_codon:yes gene_type:complete
MRSEINEKRKSLEKVKGTLPISKLKDVEKKGMPRSRYIGTTRIGFFEAL